VSIINFGQPFSFACQMGVSVAPLAVSCCAFWCIFHDLWRRYGFKVSERRRSSPGYGEGLHQSLILCCRRSLFMYQDFPVRLLPLDKEVQLHELSISLLSTFRNVLAMERTEKHINPPFFPSFAISSQLFQHRQTTTPTNKQDYQSKLHFTTNMPPSMPVVWTPGSCIQCGSTDIGPDGKCRNCGSRQ